ncbi:unnamed protein product [Musa acuminata subsp. burmannicoides]
MYHHSGERSEQEPPLIADDAYEMISKIESSQIAAHSYKDFDYDYFGFKPLEVSGMLREPLLESVKMTMILTL